MRLILCCIAILAGCATQPEVPKEVKIPVMVSCVKNPPTKPQTTDEKSLLAMDDYAATLLTWTERLELKAYAEKADAVISACR